MTSAKILRRDRLLRADKKKKRKKKTQLTCFDANVNVKVFPNVSLHLLYCISLLHQDSILTGILISCSRLLAPRTLIFRFLCDGTGGAQSFFFSTILGLSISKQSYQEGKNPFLPINLWRPRVMQNLLCRRLLITKFCPYPVSQLPRNENSHLFIWLATKIVPQNNPLWSQKGDLYLQQDGSIRVCLVFTPFEYASTAGPVSFSCGCKQQAKHASSAVLRCFNLEGCSPVGPILKVKM